MIPIDLFNHTAVVTGATGQLGRVMVRTLARAGADVVVHYHTNQERADALRDEVIGMGRKSSAVAADITTEAGVQLLRDAILEKMNAPDIVVANAVIQYEWKNVLDQPVSDYESQFRSCVLQNVLLAQAFVPSMTQSRWGRFIGINTECAMQCLPNQSAYVAGKRGMDGVLRVLAREAGPQGVTVNQVAPGWTISENVSGENTPESYLDRTALGRRGTDQEIANVVAFLASDLASFITGAYVPVCGGNVMPSI